MYESQPKEKKRTSKLYFQQEGATLVVIGRERVGDDPGPEQRGRVPATLYIGQVDKDRPDYGFSFLLKTPLQRQCIAVTPYVGQRLLNDPAFATLFSEPVLEARLAVEPYQPTEEEQEILKATVRLPPVAAVARDDEIIPTIAEIRQDTID